MIQSTQIANGFRTSVLVVATTVNNKAIPTESSVTPINIIIEPILDQSNELINGFANTQAIISAKLGNEVSSYAELVSEGFPYEDYPGTTSGDVKTSFRRLVKEAFIRTNCIRLKAINTRAEQRDEIVNNISYEQDVKNLALWIGENFRDEIVTGSKSAQTLPLEALVLRADDGRIATVSLDNEFIRGMNLPTQLVNVFVERVTSEPDGEKAAARQALNKAIGMFVRKVGSNWSSGAESASTNYETRKVYAQQLADLEEFYNFLTSTDTVMDLRNVVCMPWHARSMSSNDYTHLAGNTKRVLQRTTDDVLHILFDAFQQYRSTRHPAGVMH